MFAAIARTVIAHPWYTVSLFRELLDVSAATYPASPSTSISLAGIGETL